VKENIMDSFSIFFRILFCFAKSECELSLVILY